MRGVSAPSESWQISPRWVGVFICLRIERLCRGIQLDYVSGLCPIVWHATRLSGRYYIWVITIPCTTTGLWNSGCKVVHQEKALRVLVSSELTLRWQCGWPLLSVCQEGQ